MARVLLALLLLLPLGCEQRSEESVDPAAEISHRTSGYETPELRFAGVTLTYALRRVAGSAGMLLLLDEIRPPGSQRPMDLEFRYVETDLPAGPVEASLATLKKATGRAFDYGIDGNVIIARSVKTLAEQTVLDQPLLPPAHIEVDLAGLIHWIMQRVPNSYIRMGERRGQPVYKKVELELKEKSSIMDLLIQYTKGVDSSVHVLRAGFAAPQYVDQATPHDQNPKIVANTIGLMWSYPDPVPLPVYRSVVSTTWTLAAVAERTNTPLAILDRGTLLDNHGALSFLSRMDTGSPIELALDELGYQGEGNPRDYEWSMVNGVPVLKSERFLFFLPGRELLDEKLRGGSFEGTLAELTRWIHEHRKQPSTKLLMGGEIRPDVERAKLDVAEDTTILEALLSFARATNQGFVVVLRDSLSPAKPLDEVWAGAFISRLSDWGPDGVLPLN